MATPSRTSASATKTTTPWILLVIAFFAGLVVGALAGQYFGTHHLPNNATVRAIFMDLYQRDAARWTPAGQRASDEAAIRALQIQHCSWQHRGVADATSVASCRVLYRGTVRTLRFRKDAQGWHLDTQS